MNPRVYVVIGKNFGDEGKGRVVDDLSSGARAMRPDNGDHREGALRENVRSLVIRHNGGAQSGHTVVKKNWQGPAGMAGSAADTRFVFHELGAGSFAGADTLWADTFYPDLYKLNEEYAAFYAVSGLKSSIFSMPETPITTIDDVLINMALEKSRGDKRHGSCGMGIYEACLRTRAGFGITVGDVKRGGEKGLYERLCQNRKEYVIPRITKLLKGSQEDLCGEAYRGDYLDPDKCGEFMDLLEDDNVLWNAAVEMCDAAKKVTLIGDPEDGDSHEDGNLSDDKFSGKAIRAFLSGYDRVIFESGQGLLLDSENEEYAPHVTGSRTGLTNPEAFARRAGITIDEVVYVTRSYITRHGAGLLKHECDRISLGIENTDSTNIANEWQGDFRYAPHGSVEEFLKAPLRDLEESIGSLRESPEILGENFLKVLSPLNVSLAITHLSDTADKMLFSGDEKEALTMQGSLDADIRYMEMDDFKENPEINGIFSGFYLYN
ncbi:MAG: adenylosuccinate synthetase [Butyrivibrio sp.]|nr:adenylosuccinate synthetase [Butyrivibrio sp.]